MVRGVTGAAVVEEAEGVEAGAAVVATNDQGAAIAAVPKIILCKHALIPPLAVTTKRVDAVVKTP